MFNYVKKGDKIKMPNDVLNIAEITQDITATTKNRKENPIHYIIFDEKKINIDGKEIQLNTDGWAKLCSTFKTGSGSLMAKRLTALMFRLDKLQGKPKIPKPTA